MSPVVKRVYRYMLNAKYPQIARKNPSVVDLEYLMWLLNNA
jgi:hypothetical protein